MNKISPLYNIVGIAMMMMIMTMTMTFSTIVTANEVVVVEEKGNDNDNHSNFRFVQNTIDVNAKKGGGPVYSLCVLGCRFLQFKERDTCLIDCSSSASSSSSSSIQHNIEKQIHEKQDEIIHHIEEKIHQLDEEDDMILLAKDSKSTNTHKELEEDSHHEVTEEELPPLKDLNIETAEQQRIVAEEVDKMHHHQHDHDHKSHSSDNTKEKTDANSNEKNNNDYSDDNIFYNGIMSLIVPLGSICFFTTLAMIMKYRKEYRLKQEEEELLKFSATTGKENLI